MADAYEGEPHLIVAADRNGRPWKKHFVEVRDIVHGYEQALVNSLTFGKTYQLASSEPFRWEVMIPYLAEQIGAPCSKVDLPITPTYYEYDLSAAKRDFGYSPPLSIYEMIDEAVAHRNTGKGEIIPTTL
jgi:nucleoside-diphosphate-sugar epimerase